MFLFTYSRLLWLFVVFLASVLYGHGGFCIMFCMDKNFEPSIKLNLARNCLRYAVRLYHIKEMYVPYYICPVVFKVLREEGCRIRIYHIDEKFFPVQDFGKEDFVLYPNYFGICLKNAKKLSFLYKNLIVDNAQAFYAPHTGLASFNSARKFFDVSDGAYLFGCKKFYQEFEKDNSEKRYSALFSGSSSDFFERFCTNEKILDKEPVKEMSYLTERILSSVDYEREAKKRRENFDYLHSCLKYHNELCFELEEDDVPMVYPFKVSDERVGKRLVSEGFELIRYWEGVYGECYERELAHYLLPLPVSAKYEFNYMRKLIDIIKDEIKLL